MVLHMRLRLYLFLMLAVVALAACEFQSQDSSAPGQDSDPADVPGTADVPDTDDVQEPPEIPDASDDTVQAGFWKSLDEYYGSIDYSCESDSDCVIKDVHNCCGMYPECVNKDAIVDPGFVMKACSDAGKAAVCGFPSIDSCICNEGRCSGVAVSGQNIS